MVEPSSVVELVETTNRVNPEPAANHRQPVSHAVQPRTSRDGIRVEADTVIGQGEPHTRIHQVEGEGRDCSRARVLVRTHFDPGAGTGVG